MSGPAQRDRANRVDQSLQEQCRLGCCSPNACAGPLTVSEAWPIKAYNPVAACKPVHESADDEILNHRAVAMEQHHARSCAITTLEEVETQPLTLDEVADWWVLPFSDEREHDVPYE